MKTEHRGKDNSTTQKAESRNLSLLSAFYSTYERLILGGLAIVVFVVGWEVVSRSGLINSIFLSSPSRIIVTAYDLFSSGVILNDLRLSGQEFLVGFGLAIITGIPLGITVGWYRRFNYMVDPFLSALYATPRITLLPLVIMWLGIGLLSKVAIIYLGAIFPITINSLNGVRTIDLRLLNVARCFGAGERDVFKKVVLPSCVPFIVTGLRLGLAHAITGVIVAEFFAARGGIGFMITTAGAMFETDTVFVGIMITAFCGIAFTEILKRVEKKFEKWRPQVGAG